MNYFFLNYRLTDGNEYLFQAKDDVSFCLFFCCCCCFKLHQCFCVPLLLWYSLYCELRDTLLTSKQKASIKIYALCDTTTLREQELGSVRLSFPMCYRNCQLKAMESTSFPSSSAEHLDIMILF